MVDRVVCVASTQSVEKSSIRAFRDYIPTRRETSNPAIAIAHFISDSAGERQRETLQDDEVSWATSGQMGIKEASFFLLAKKQLDS